MKIYYTIISCATSLLCSCSPYYYAPNKGNIPNLRSKNDLRFDAGLGGGFIMKGADIQAAYAVTSHFGAMVNGALTKGKESAINYRRREYTSSQYLEAGLGYFAFLEENRNWVFELFGGAGKGNYKIRFNPEQYSRYSMNKFFLQPSLSYTHPRKNIEFGIGSRFSGLKYTLQSAAILDELDYDYPRARHVPNTTGILWEPSFRFSAGSKSVKGFVSFTPSIAILDNSIPREIINLNLGARLTFNTSRKQ